MSVAFEGVSVSFPPKNTQASLPPGFEQVKAAWFMPKPDRNMNKRFQKEQQQTVWNPKHEENGEQKESSVKTHIIHNKIQERYGFALENSGASRADTCQQWRVALLVWWKVPTVWMRTEVFALLWTSFFVPIRLLWYGLVKPQLLHEPIPLTLCWHSRTTSTETLDQSRIMPSWNLLIFCALLCWIARFNSVMADGCETFAGSPSVIHL